MEFISRCINTLFVMLTTIAMAKGDYECVCSYDVEQAVYSQPSLTSAPSGIMYEFDCKPVFNDINFSDTRFQALQFEKKVVYVPVSSSISKQLCQGSVPSADKVVTTPMPTSSSSSTPTTTTNLPLTTPSASFLSSARSTLTILPSNMPSRTPMDQLTTNTSNKTDNATDSSTSTHPAIYTKLATTTMSSTKLNSQTLSITSKTTTQSSANNSKITNKKPTSSTVTLKTTDSTSQTVNSQNTSTPIVTSNSQPSTVQYTALSVVNTTSKIISSTTTQTPSTTKDLSTASYPSTPFLTSSTIANTTISRSTHSPTSTVISSSAVLSTVSPHCPAGWVLFQSSCYKFHTSGRATWDMANADCISKKSHIVFVESVDEDRFLQTYLSNHINIHINDNSDTGTWIGATEMGNSGFWVWRDSYTNTDTSIGYNHWHRGQPDSSNEQCAGMIGRHNFEWHDYECSQSMFYVCETSVAGAGSSSLTHSASLAPAQHSHSLADCESGWTQHHDSCYLFVTDQGHLEWDWARDFCLSKHSRLAIIETRDEDLFLANEMRKRINTDDDDEEDTGVWLAGTDDAHEGRWVWRDTLRHRDTPISGYTNWYPGEPDSGDHEKDEDCLCMIGNKGFQWQDWRCKDNMYAICEKPRTVLAGLTLVG